MTDQLYRRFSIAERDRRWAEVRKLMKRDGLAAIVAPQNPGHSTDWQADARYLSQVGGGADAAIAVVFPLQGEVTAIATSAAERWNSGIQNWTTDVREAHRRYGKVAVDRLRELGITNEKIGITGLGEGTRTPEGSVMHGTYRAIADAFPNATYVDASSLLQEVRERKSPEEIAVVQCSIDLIEKAIEAQTRAAQPGVPDYVVWAETMSAMLLRGSELTMHFNWIADQYPGRTLTRPTGRYLQKNDVIVAEIEASVVGYRAQQIRPLAIHDCDPVYKELSKAHCELYPQLLAFFQPGVTVKELIEKSIALGKKVAAGGGALRDAKTSLIVHGRGLGDDRPLLLTNLDADVMYEATERTMDFQFPENGTYIVKPTITTADKKYQFIWGDTVHLKAGGAQRFGKSEPGLIISKPGSFSFPTDVTVYDGFR